MGLFDALKGNIGAIAGTAIGGPVGGMLGSVVDQGLRGGGSGGGGGAGFRTPTTGERRAESDFLRKQRENDLFRGKERAKESFAKVGPDDFQKIIDQRRAQLNGLTSGEKNVLESQGIGGIQQGEQSALRQLRGAQSAAGIKGPLAGGQAGQVLQKGLAERRQLGQDVFLEDMARRREALGQLEGTLGRERTGALGIQFGEAAAGAAERAAADQFLLGKSSLTPLPEEKGGFLSKTLGRIF